MSKQNMVITIPGITSRPTPLAVRVDPEVERIGLEWTSDDGVDHKVSLTLARIIDTAAAQEKFKGLLKEGYVAGTAKSAALGAPPGYVPLPPNPVATKRIVGTKCTFTFNGLAVPIKDYIAAEDLGPVNQEPQVTVKRRVPNLTDAKVKWLLEQTEAALSKSTPGATLQQTFMAWQRGQDPLYGPYEFRLHYDYRGKCEACGQAVAEGQVAAEKKRGGRVWFIHTPDCKPKLLKKR